MRRSVLVLVGLLAVGLVQCGPTPTPIPTPTPTRLPPTETPPPTATPAATPVVWQATREEYYPMAVGNYWAYEKVSEHTGGETDNLTIREEVEEIGTVDDKFPAYLVGKKVTGYSGLLDEDVDLSSGGWLQVSSEGVWVIASVGENYTQFFSEPRRWYKFPLAIGERFEFDSSLEGTQRCTVEDLETVAVPAGIFEDCLRIRCSASLQGHSTEWLAPGVGPVKEILVDMYTSSHKELVEYNVEFSPAPHQPRPLARWWDLELILSVEDVLDGDTMSVEYGTFQQSWVDRVRYIGIDSPELDEPCGVEARRANEQLLALPFGWLKMGKDVSQRDKYGRLLRYVYISSPACPNGMCMVNYDLVWRGWARAVEYPPDTAFAEEFAAAEREARIHVRGCWGMTPLPPGWE